MSKTLEYVGFWSRCIAGILDSILIFMLFVPIILLFFNVSSLFGGDAFVGSSDIATGWLIPFGIIFLCWSFWQATPGKLAMGARIVDAKTGNAPGTLQFILRYVAYFIAAIPLGMGFIWIAFDRKKRGWHDLIAGTVVVRKVNRVEFSEP
jgi:uncharacterized RDD family membrane protein YckC